MTHLFKAGRFLIEDLLSTIFFMILFSVTHDLKLAIGTGIAVGLLQVAITLIRRKPVDAMQWLSLGLVVVMGGASLLTHDPRFVMIKPTVIFIAVGMVMMKPGWMNRYLPPIVDEHARGLAIAFGYMWAVMMFATAAGNLGLALYASPATWATVMSIVPLVSKIALFAIQYITLRVVIRARIRAAGGTAPEVMVAA